MRESIVAQGLAAMSVGVSPGAPKFDETIAGCCYNGKATHQV